MLNPGQIISGKYRIVRLIGDGGMGSVYEAQHVILGSHVALKFLHPELAEQPQLKQRFLQEARVSATVKNAHIVSVSDVDTAPEGAYLVMELLQGEPLQELLEREGTLSIPQAAAFGLQILEGLSAAHQRGIVHRDLKPDNVFVTPAPSGPMLKLLDFGIAKLRQSAEYQMALTRPGSVMGTPEYMAPEQAFSADEVDQRSDLYSVGVILFQMLSGKVPVEGDNPQEIAEKIIHGRSLTLDQVAPNLPPALIGVVNRAIRGNPDERFTSAEELRAALLPFAPLIDRQSDFGTSSTAGGFATGMATPFAHGAATPQLGSMGERSSAAFTPQAAAHATGLLDRASNVSPTVPPQDAGPPPASHLAPAHPVRTASMPEMPAMVVRPNPTALPNTAPPAPRRRSGSTGWILSIAGVLLVGSAAAGWYYYTEYVQSYPTPPPMPVPRQTAVPTAIAEPGFDPEPDVVLDDQARTPPRPGPVPRPSPRPAPGPAPKLPPIELPTELPELPPLPPGLPTELPTSLPTSFPIPGLTPPPAAPTEEITETDP